MKGRVMVVGSVNIDTTTVVDHLPRPGETIVARERHVGLGGKGANQALAAGAAGASVRLVATIGTDLAGASARARLAARGIDVRSVALVDAPTGEASIVVDASTGENMIVVEPGANAQLHVAVAAMEPSRGAVVVTQLEARPDLVAEIVERARSVGASSLVNAAPALSPVDSLLGADVVVVNELELTELVGAGSPFEQVRRWAAFGGGSIVATLGAAGAVWCTRGADAGHVPAPQVDVVDTTGAGDCFVGWLAAALAGGVELAAATATAVAAASDSTRRAGANTA